MKNKIAFIFILFLIGTASCKKTQENLGNTAELRIKPQCLCGDDGVRVRLFESLQDYQQNSNFIQEVYSEGNNPVIFNGLEEKIYWFQLFKVCGTSMTANNFCTGTALTFTTNGSLNSSQPQEIEVSLCY